MSHRLFNPLLLYRLYLNLNSLVQLPRGTVLVLGLRVYIRTLSTFLFWRSTGCAPWSGLRTCTARARRSPTSLTLRRGETVACRFLPCDIWAPTSTNTKGSQITRHAVNPTLNFNHLNDEKGSSVAPSDQLQTHVHLETQSLVAGRG